MMKAPVNYAGWSFFICALLCAAFPSRLSAASAINGAALQHRQAEAAQQPEYPTISKLIKHAAGDHKQAVRLARNQQYEKALALLDPYMKRQQQFPRIAVDYMVILNWARRHQEAILYFEKIPANIKVPDYLRNAMADSYYQLGKFRKAQALFAAVPASSPEYGKAASGQLRCLIALREYEQAMKLASRHKAGNPLTRSFLAIAAGHYGQGFDGYIDLLEHADDEAGLLQRMREHLQLLSDQDKTRISSELMALAQSRQTPFILHNLLWMIWLDQKPDDTMPLDYHDLIGKYSIRQLSQVGWGLYRMGSYALAEQVLLAGYLQDKSDFQTSLGLMYSHTRMGHLDLAGKIARQMQAKHHNSADFHYAQAFLHEQQQDYWAAVRDYDQILSRHPDDQVARKLQIEALSALGASTQAMIEARRFLPENEKLQDSLQETQAVTRLHWDEAVSAMKILNPLLKKQRLRARLDYIPVLIGADEADKAVQAYEQLLEDGIKPPLWLQQSVAGAYLTVEQREKSLGIYNHVLETWPDSFEARIGKFYSLSELQRWTEADAVLKALEAENIPWKFGRFPNEHLNSKRATVAIARSYWLLGQQRYPEAEAYLNQLYTEAPGNIEFREALASLHRLRGWKHRALREVRIIDAMQSREVSPPSRLQLSETLNGLEAQEEARLLLKEEQARHPRSAQVIRLQRAYAVDEMNQLEFGMHYENSQDGAIDLTGESHINHPLSLHTDMFFSIMYRRSTQDQLLSKLNRLGVGIDHRFNSRWRMRETLSGDYVKNGEAGLLSELFWNPDDHWRTRIYYDSYIADMPVRARVFDITAKQAGGDISYRWSDWREAGLSLSRSSYADGNKRIESNMYYEQNILARGDWRLRMFGCFYASRASLNNTPYFNPKRDAALNATLMIEHNTWHRYERMKGKFDRWFTQRLYVSGGAYWQKAFSTGTIGSLRYEQDIAFSDTHFFNWSVGWGSHPYDGAAVGTYTIDARYQWKF